MAEILSQRKRSTQKAARYHLNRYILPMFINSRLDALGSESQQAFVTSIAGKVSGRTLANIMGTLSSMHTALLRKGGASPKEAQRQLRYSNARTTLEIYGHVVGDGQREAVERAAKYIN